MRGWSTPVACRSPARGPCSLGTPAAGGRASTEEARPAPQPRSAAACECMCMCVLHVHVLVACACACCMCMCMCTRPCACGAQATRHKCKCACKCACTCACKSAPGLCRAHPLFDAGQDREQCLAPRLARAAQAGGGLEAARLEVGGRALHGALHGTLRRLLGVRLRVGVRVSGRGYGQWSGLGSVVKVRVSGQG